MSQAKPALPARPVPKWSELSFALTETDYMYRSFGDCRREAVWDDGQFVPFSDILVSPAAAFMSYGLGIFEGLKAQKPREGQILLFRPDANARRFQRSAERLMMAPFPEHRFVEAVKELVRHNSRFVPPAEYGSFYIRPMQHAIEPKLGLGPSSLLSVTMFGCPVGSYFRGGAPDGVRLQVLEQGRMAPGGTGFCKAMGNYAGAIFVAHQWKQKGVDDVLYLDARHTRFLTATSGSNPFVFLKSGTLVTPPLDDQILPGVTRDSTLRVARELLHLKVEERPLSIEEVIEEGEEFFCTGTAWTLMKVREIVYREKPYSFPKEEARSALLEILRGIQLGQREDPFGWAVEV